MQSTLHIKITLTDKTVVELAKEVPEAKAFLRDAPASGFTDPTTGRFHPAESIRTIEVLPPTEFPEFSQN